MSISLSNHESRITALENKSGISLTSGSGWVDFSNGLQMRFGYKTLSGNDESWRTYDFQKAFTNNCISICSGDSPGSTLSGHITHIKYINRSQFAIASDYAGVPTTTTSYYIAIGYLISNSIRSLLGGGLGWL